MSWNKWVAIALGVALMAPVAVSFAADEKPDAAEATVEKSDKPAKSDGDKASAKAPRLWSWWAKMQTLTAEQRAQIDEIHKKALAEKRKIEEQEEADIMALLSAEQKAELQSIKDEESAKRKARDAERRAEKAAEEKATPDKAAEKPE